MIFPMVTNNNIPPFRIVAQDTTGAGDNFVVLCGAGVLPIGVAPRHTRHPPGSFFNDDGFCAIAGEDIPIYSEDETCLVAAAGAFAAGAILKSDVNGRATVASTGNYVIGITGQAALVSGDLVEIQIRIGTY